MAVIKSKDSVRFLQYVVVTAYCIFLTTSFFGCSDLEHSNINDPESSGFENSGNVEFTISSAQNSPLSDCSIVFDSGNYATTTAIDGKASFNLPVGDHQYTVSLDGYSEYSNSFSIGYNETTTIPVELNGMPIILDSSIKVTSFYHEIAGGVTGNFGYNLSFLFSDSDGLSDISSVVIKSPVGSDENIILNTSPGRNSIETTVDLGFLSDSGSQLFPYVDAPFTLTIIDNQADSSSSFFALENFFRLYNFYSLLESETEQSGDTLKFSWDDPRQGNSDLFWFSILDYKIEILEFDSETVLFDSTFSFESEPSAPKDSFIVSLSPSATYDYRLTIFDPFDNETRSAKQSFNTNP